MGFGRTSFAILVSAASLGTAAAFATLYYRKKRELSSVVEHIRKELADRRQEERAGRIRAEVKLRTVLKNLQEIKSFANADASQLNEMVAKKKRTMLLNCIGTVVSPYTKRMGTPRQPSLVPASRGFIELKNVSPEAVSGIELYSHVWIIFEFHANTDTVQSSKTKIRPPRAGGDKVGQLATRSPHRPNPLGLSLVKMVKWDVSTRRLHVAGLDLVNGTPVYDIKPAVPWDVPGYPGLEIPLLHVPEWVTQQDEISTVRFEDAARTQLHECIGNGLLAPLYTLESDGVGAAEDTILQILSQDPRSSHKGLKVNQRGSVSTVESTGATTYNIVFCETKISFTVTQDSAIVTGVLPVTFDDNQYVDGVPLISSTL
jgi:tRNA-Thr(GGU) m(6)t(6)A37 methyltransferase TsaA